MVIEIEWGVSHVSGGLHTNVVGKISLDSIADLN